MLHASRPEYSRNADVLQKCYGHSAASVIRYRYIFTVADTCGMMNTLHTRCRSGSSIVVRPQLFECVENLYKKKKKKRKKKYRTEFQHKKFCRSRLSRPPYRAFLPRAPKHRRAITSRGGKPEKAIQSGGTQPAGYGYYHLEKSKKVEKKRWDRLTCRSKLERPPHWPSF
jgi:hypothetical protein